MICCECESEAIALVIGGEFPDGQREDDAYYPVCRDHVCEVLANGIVHGLLYLRDLTGSDSAVEKLSGVLTFMRRYFSSEFDNVLPGLSSDEYELIQSLNDSELVELVANSLELLLAQDRIDVFRERRY